MKWFGRIALMLILIAVVWMGLNAAEAFRQLECMGEFLREHGTGAILISAIAVAGVITLLLRGRLARN